MIYCVQLGAVSREWVVTEFRLLGPVEVWTAGRRLEAGPPQQRLVLAALSADPARLVTAETLIARVWGEDPPAAARRALHAHIAKIRQMLRWTGGTAPLAYSSGGYVLEIPPDEVDLQRFRRLAGRARQPGPDRLALLRQALALWRGTPLAGLPGQWAAEVRESWSRRRVDTLLAWADAEIEAGDPAAPVEALTELAAEEPLLEPVTAALMRALHGAGRNAEALDCYARARRRLVGELGIEPGAELVTLHRKVLRGAAPPPPPAPAPAQLPPDVPAFVGRHDALARLTAAIADQSVVVLSGTAGVGKTALAVRWATTVADRFPGGLLYVNLRGFDPTGSALQPAEAVRGFLEAFDVPPPRIPVTLSAQVSMYRRLVAGRRVLVLLDNARDADQVRPLLPSAPGCLTLVTSRNLLPALVVADGAYPMTLDLLTVAESRQLLAARLGPARVAAEPQPVDDLIDRCARLPLAMTLVATRATVHDRFTLADLVRELREAGDRLDALSSPDPAIDVRTVLSWSYRRLSPDAAALFRRLGLHCGPDITPAAAASLLGVTTRQVTALLGELADAHLIVEHVAGRFTLHDLLRAYAAEQVRAADPPPVRQAARHRMLDYYLHSADAADALLYPHRDEITLDPVADGVTPQKFADDRAALAWLTAERVVLLAAVDQPGFPAHALRTALVLVTFLDRLGYWHEQIAALHTALDAVRQLGDAPGQGHTLRILGLVHARLGNQVAAETRVRQSLDVYAGCGDRSGQARAHRDLANLYWGQGRGADALLHLRRVLALSETAGLRAGSAFTAYALACVNFLEGDHRQAVTRCRQAVAGYREIGDRVGEAIAWEGRGLAHFAMGHHRQALLSFRRTLRLRREIGDRYLEADSLTRIGDTHEAAGRPPEARAAWLSAHEILAELGHPDADRLKAKLAPTTGEIGKSPHDHAR